MSESARTGGALRGVLGVVLFSMSLPAMWLAVSGGIDPLFVGSARPAMAGWLALAVLMIGWVGWPTRAEWRGLVLVAGGVMLGFPLLTTAATAVAAVALARERPSLRFWLAWS